MNTQFEQDIYNILSLHSGTWVQQAIVLDILKHMCVKGYKGDILDIGSGDGKNTIQMARISSKFSKKMHAIEIRKEYSNVFDKTNFNINLQILDCKSQEAIEFYKNNKFCFVYLDACFTGLEQIIEEIYKNMAKGVIIVDDTNEPAIEKAISKFNKIPIKRMWQRGRSSFKSYSTRHKEFQIIFKNE